MSTLSDTVTWLNDPAHWRDTPSLTGIPTRLIEHLQYSGIALAGALIIGLPLGLLVGHTGHGGWLVTMANALRALPTFGFLILGVVVISPHIHSRGDAVYLIPTEVVLIILAIPPIFANTVAGIQNVDPAVSDAAKGMGMRGRQILARVEIPNALPLIFSGLRSATLQVIATATIAAYVSLGGFGRFVFDGLSQQDYAQMTGGAILVAALAVVIDFLLAVIQRYTVSRGVSERFSRRNVAQPNAVNAAVVEAEVAA
jgi:osmoprotectant transport system permease protein